MSTNSPPRYIQMYVYIKTCKLMFIVAILIKTKMWKKLKRPSTAECIHIIQYTYIALGVVKDRNTLDR